MEHHINEVVEAVWTKQRMVASKSPDSIPNIAVYMSYEYHSLCKSEINGEVTRAVHEFFDSDTILGFQVYRVINITNRHGEVKHPPFIVVNLDA